MRKVLVALAALLAATAVAAAKDPARSPILGVVWSGGGRLAWLDPMTLEPTRLSEFRFAAGFSTAVSPDGRAIALQTGEGPIRIVAAESLRVVRTIPAPRARLGFSIWPRPDRLITAPSWYGQGDVIVLDPRAGRIVSRRPLNGSPLAFASTRRALVLLLGAKDRIGPVTLAVVATDGSVRSVRLAELRAGVQTGRGVARQQQLGLATDPPGRRAAVVAPGLVADVDLMRLTVTLHRLAARRPAAVQKAFDGWSRHAVWAGPSTFAITGTDYDASADGQRLRQVPAGLTLVDTRTWQARVIEPEASEVTSVRRTLLATGVRCEPGARTCRGIGLRGYALDGSLRFHLFGDEPIGDVQVAHGLVYVVDCNSYCFRIVDAASGRMIREALLSRQTRLLA